MARPGDQAGHRLLKAIALDKTGTITEGKPRLVEWEMLTTGLPEPQAEHIAAALAAHSDHPVSRAIAAGLTPNSVEARNFSALSGRGIEADIDGQRYVLGNHRLIEERGQCSAEIEAVLHRHQQAGRTVSLLATASGVLALFAVADTIKPSSAAAMRELKAMGITPVMLTGDNQATAEAIGREAGLTDIRGNLLPEDKLAAIKALQKQYGATAMTGDGINDAPALAQAALAPQRIIHSWVEVSFEGRWVNLEGFILDMPYMASLHRRFPDRKRFCGYGAATPDLSSPGVDWRGQDTYIQKDGIADDFGVFDGPDEFYAHHGSNLSGRKRWLYAQVIRHRMNAQVRRIRAEKW